MGQGQIDFKVTGLTCVGMVTFGACPVFMRSRKFSGNCPGGVPASMLAMALDCRHKEVHIIRQDKTLTLKDMVTIVNHCTHPTPMAHTEGHGHHREPLHTPYTHDSH